MEIKKYIIRDEDQFRQIRGQSMGHQNFPMAVTGYPCLLLGFIDRPRSTANYIAITKTDIVNLLT